MFPVPTILLGHTCAPQPIYPQFPLFLGVILADFRVCTCCVPAAGGVFKRTEQSVGGCGFQRHPEAVQGAVQTYNSASFSAGSAL